MVSMIGLNSSSRWPNFVRAGPAAQSPRFTLKAWGDRPDVTEASFEELIDALRQALPFESFPVPLDEVDDVLKIPSSKWPVGAAVSDFSPPLWP